MAIIQSGATSDLWTIDPTSKAGRVTEYDTNGNAVVKVDRASLGVTPGTTSGYTIVGADYKTPVLARSTSDGSLIVGDRTVLLYDRAEGAAVDTNKWIETTTTMTITQATGVITFNANSTTTTTTGAMHTSHRFLPFINRTGLVMRVRARHTAHTANNLIEQGFASPASATSASLVNGAVWRKDGTGQYVPVLSVNGSETLGTAISNGTFTASIPATDYAIFEIVMHNNHAIFSIYKTTGEVVNTQTLDIQTSSTSFQQTHMQAMIRTYNAGAASPAVQVLLDDVSVWAIDFNMSKPWPHQMASMNYEALTSPTAYTQLANYANSAAPASATLSNTAAGYTTLGGQWQFVAVAGAETDYALFGFTVPSPYSLYVTGLRISCFNMGAAVATTPTTLQWAIAANSSAVSLATAGTYPPMRQAIGMQSLAIATAIGGPANQDVVWTTDSPIVVFPGRFFHIILKMPVGTATASQIVRGTAIVNGYFD